MRLLSRMVLSSALSLVAVLVAGGPALGQAQKKAAAQPQPKAVAPAPAAATPAPAIPPEEAAKRMDALLLKWEKASQKVTSLTVKFERKDVDPMFGNKEYEGEAKLESPNKALLDFLLVTVAADGKKTKNYEERIICDGKKVYQFKVPTKQVFIFPLSDNPNQKALDEGPLPFLFNMKAEKARARYDMTYVAENQTTYKIQIVPRLAIDKEEFSRAQLLLDKVTFLPQGIRLTSPNGKETRTYMFKPGDMAQNTAIAPVNFDAETMATSYKNKGWKLIDSPNGQAQTKAAAPTNAQRRAPGQPAMKTGAIPPR